MASARVALNGRFRPGTQVRLVKVRDERALRSEGGETVGTAKVDSDGLVKFTSGVEVGARYFIVGQVDGQPLEVRARGRAADDPAEVLEQAPVSTDRVRLSDGSWLDETPERVKAPSMEVGPAPSQQQVPAGTVQRSDTPRGTAHPLDPAEPAPYPRQEDVPDGTVQMSDTETGRAAPIIESVQRQEDVPSGVVQRSDTPTGVATPIPVGNAVAAQQDRESSLAKAARGEPVRAAAEPLKVPTGGKARRSSAAPVNVTPGAPNDRDVLTGHDAQGQPADPDVARALGIEPASKPVEATRGEPKAAASADPAVSEPETAGASKTETASTGAGKRLSGKAPVSKTRSSGGSSRSSKRSKR